MPLIEKRNHKFWLFLSDVEMFGLFNAFSGHVDRFERIESWVARISGRISQIPQHTCFWVSLETLYGRMILVSEQLVGAFKETLDWGWQCQLDTAHKLETSLGDNQSHGGDLRPWHILAWVLREAFKNYYPPFPLSFFEHNDCPLRGGGTPQFR